MAAGLTPTPCPSRGQRAERSHFRSPAPSEAISDLAAPSEAISDLAAPSEAISGEAPRSLGDAGPRIGTSFPPREFRRVGRGPPRNRKAVGHGPPYGTR